jgi:hypothetical protein
MPYSTSLLIQLPSTTPMPRHSVSLIASRSIARLIASRTRLSWNGLLVVAARCVGLAVTEDQLCG